MDEKMSCSMVLQQQSGNAELTTE